MLFRNAVAVGVVLCALGVRARMDAQRGGVFMGTAEDPAIQYATAPLNNAVVELNEKLQNGSVRLSFEGRSGFLRSALEALHLPVDSQLLVFSRGSLQRKLIGEQNPRALFFNDRVALGWVRGGDVLEVAAHDESAGVVFYALDQRQDPASPPQFKRTTACLGCHMVDDTLRVPGLLMFSTMRPDHPQGFSRANFIDQSHPFAQRFGGWFVTGNTGSITHLGNGVSALDGHGRELDSVEGLFDSDGYRAHTSDIAAHLVFAHQTRMINLITRAGWEARAADPILHPSFNATPEAEINLALMMNGVASEVVDYLLFVDEARLPAPVHGRSGFTERFSAIGPRDRKSRSLHELDLSRRLMKYPCSYLIYSPSFDALPPRVKDPIYRRMWQVLSGQERDPRYREGLSLAERRAIVEILRDTKKDLPPYFQSVTK